MGLKEKIGQKSRYTEGYEGKQIELKDEFDQKCRLKGDASKLIGLKEYTDKKCRFIDDGNEFGAAESFQQKISGDVECRSDCKTNYAVKEKESVEVHVQCDDDEKEKEVKEGCDFKNELGCSDSKDDVCTDEEARNTNTIKKNNSNGSDRDNSEVRHNEGGCGEKIIENDFESDFSNGCKGDAKSSKEDQIDKDHTAGGGETDDSDSAGYDAENCSENIILTIDYDETAESCSLESGDGGWKCVGIASTFGIMTIYCNSELHSWSFKGEDALRN